MKKQKRSTKQPAASRSASPPCSPVPVGWQCPRCGKCLAPWMPECNCHITIVVNPPVQPYHTPETGDPFADQTITVSDTANAPLHLQGGALAEPRKSESVCYP